MMQDSDILLSGIVLGVTGTLLFEALIEKPLLNRWNTWKTEWNSRKELKA